MAGNEKCGLHAAKIDVSTYKRLKLSEFDDHGCDRLVLAIVEKAAEDYIWGRNAELKRPKNGPSVQRMNAEAFFRGPWFEMLTGLDGAAVIYGLERQVKAGCKRRHISRPSEQQNASSG